MKVIKAYGDGAETWAVCGKALRPDNAFAKLHRGESKLRIYCPLFLEACRKDRKADLERCVKRALLRELNTSEATPPPTEGGPR